MINQQSTINGIQGSFKIPK